MQIITFLDTTEPVLSVIYGDKEWIKCVSCSLFGSMKAIEIFFSSVTGIFYRTGSNVTPSKIGPIDPIKKQKFTPLCQSHLSSKSQYIPFLKNMKNKPESCNCRCRASLVRKPARQPSWMKVTCKNISEFSSSIYQSFKTQYKGNKMVINTITYFGKGLTMSYLSGLLIFI